MANTLLDIYSLGSCYLVVSLDLYCYVCVVVDGEHYVGDLVRDSMFYQSEFEPFVGNGVEGFREIYERDDCL